MATYSINEYTDGKMLPFTEFKITFPSDTVEFVHLVEGASVSLVPVTRPDDRGMPIVVAYKLEASASVWESNYEELLPELRLINKSVPTRILFRLKGASAQLDIQVVDTILEASWGCYAEIVGGAEFPTLTIKMSGLFSVDAIDMTTNPLFNQYW